MEEYPQLKIIVGASTYKLFEDGEVLSETVRYHKGANRYYDAYNTALQLDTSGVQFYHKSKLVQGVEMMPFTPILKHFKWLSINLGGVSGSLGIQSERTVFRSNQGQVAPIICYESIYGEYVLDYARSGADLLSIITNDGWWDNTQGHKQHLSYAKLRSIETRKNIVRSANTGISSIINYKGEVIKTIAYEEEGLINQRIGSNKKRI